MSLVPRGGPLRRSLGVAARNARNYGPVISYAVNRALRTAARSRFKGVGSRTTTSDEPGSSAPLTGHYDYKTDYRKRRLTRRRRRVFRRRRRWRNRIIRTVRESTIGSSHILRRSFQPDVTSAAGSSASVSYTMYGLNGTADPALNTNNDIGLSFYQMDTTSWSNWESSTLSAVNNRLHALHGTMEVTMVNTGENDALVEVYYIRARRRVEAAMLNPNHLYNIGFNKQGPTKEPDTGAQIGTELVPTELGVTPFQNSLFCRHFQIYKRQKFRIPVGGEVSFVKTDRRRRTYTLSGVKPFAWDRNTSGVLVQFQGVASAGMVETPATPAKITFSVVRRYRFKFTRDDLPTDGRN